MPFIQENGLEYFQFQTLNNFPLIHGIFTRKGGVSPEPWKSLNLGGTVNDPKVNIIENRRRVFEAIQRPVETGLDVWQVHGRDIFYSTAPRPLDAPHEKYDGIITNSKEITLLMRFADCVPVMLYDPENHAIGLVHAGWQGTGKRICESAVDAMKKQFNSVPQKLIACIGPSIGPDHYEVGHDVVQTLSTTIGTDFDSCYRKKNGSYYVDLWKANEMVLRQSGVDQIEISGLCTACDLTRWYSHRAEKGKTGRFGAVIALTQGR